MFKKNIIANYISQIYVTLIGILLLPLYIKYMGAEAYGLVGFFAMLQAWFGLLDLGLTPTVARESARYNAGALSSLKYRQLYRALSVIFISIAVIGTSLLYIFTNKIAVEWLNVTSLNLADVGLSLKIMALCVGLRWVCGLYRGVITGSEKIVWLSVFNSVIATLRFVFVLVSMWIWGFTPVVFFMHQLIVAVIEFLGLWAKSSQLLPRKLALASDIGWSLKPIKTVLKFSLTIAFTSMVWVAVTQTDKLVLSGVLSLEMYGYFTLAILVANGINIISAPVSNALMPRMANLQAQSNEPKLFEIYKSATQLVAVVVSAVSVSLFIVAHPLLLLWTGDVKIADNAAPILQLYALGNGCLALAAFPYYLQYAKGNLYYHFIGNVILLFVLVPSIIFSATYYGAIGAGYAWLIINASYLLFWVAFVHYKLAPDLHFGWIMNDCLKIVVPVAILGVLFLFFPFESNGLLWNVFYILVVSLALLLMAVLSSDKARTIVKKQLTKNQLLKKN